MALTCALSPALPAYRRICPVRRPHRAGLQHDMPTSMMPYPTLVYREAGSIALDACPTLGHLIAHDFCETKFMANGAWPLDRNAPDSRRTAGVVRLSVVAGACGRDPRYRTSQPARLRARHHPDQQTPRPSSPFAPTRFYPHPHQCPNHDRYGSADP